MGIEDNGLNLHELAQRLETLAFTYGQPDGKEPS